MWPTALWPGSEAMTFGLAEVVADEAEAAVDVEAVAVVGDDAGGFLAAMLERVKAEGGDGRGVGDAPDAEDAALLVQLVVIDVDESGGCHLKLLLAAVGGAERPAHRIGL